MPDKPEITARQQVGIDSKNSNLSQQEQLHPASHEIQRERNLLDLILSTAGALIIVTDINGKVVRFNRASQQLTGYTEQALLGKHFWDYIVPEAYIEETRIFFEQFPEQELPAKYESMWLGRDGSTRVIEWSNASIRNDQHELEYLIGTGLDVTEKRSAEAMLIRSEANLSYAQSIAHIGSWELHFKTEELWWSNEVYNVFEVDKSSFELTAKNVYALFHPEDLTIVREKEREAITSGKLDVTHRIITPKGNIRVVHTQAELKLDENGVPEMFRGITQDVTENRKLERESQKLQRQLQQAQKMESIGQLTGGIAHDFNNILAAILGYTQLAISKLAKNDVTKVPDFLKEVEIAGKRARDLVVQMLAFSRGSSQANITLNPSSIVKESVKLLRSAIPTSMEINTYIQAKNAYITSDALQLQQAIINLIINARDSLTEKGSINISQSEVTIEPITCSSCHQTFEGSFVSIAVSDTGSGISQEITSRIFEPFFTTKEVGKGSGMGLAMVHGLVHSSHGHIKLQTSPQGTIVELLFPSAIQTETEVGQDLLPTEQQSTTKKEHILVVDDEVSVANFIAELLRMLNYQVTVSTSSKDALSKIQNSSNHFQLVITDQTMPELTGLELAQKISESGLQIPVILCSGYSDVINDENKKSHPVAAFLTKPIDQARLISNIKLLLEPCP